MRPASALALSLVVGLSGAAFGQTTPTGPPASSGRYVAIGCLSRPGTSAAPRYVVVDRRGGGPTSYRLEGDPTEFARHVGHTVEARGALTASGALKVSALVWIASSCRPAAK